MKITFLGTGTSTGIPMIANNHPVCKSTNLKDKRLRSSIMITHKNENYIVDCGPDFRQQMLRENVQHLKVLFFTHEHSDHTAGLDDIRPYSYLMGEVPIYASERVITNLKKRFEYIFETENRYPSAPKVSTHIISEPMIMNEMQITPIEVLHGRLPITAYRFDTVAYLTDVKTITEAEKIKLKNLDVLIVNALRIEEHLTHFNLEEALAFVKEINPKKAYFTHISHHLGFHDQVEKELPDNVFLAYDGLQLEL